MKVVKKKIADLIPAEYNPRRMTPDERLQIKSSLMRFGFVDPVIINVHPERKNIIVGGHQRTKVADQDLGLKEVPCVEVNLTLEQERELNIRLNKNSGSWDFDLLNEHFESNDLVSWGFQLSDLNLEFESDTPELTENVTDPEPENVCPKCNHKW